MGGGNIQVPLLSFVFKNKSKSLAKQNRAKRVKNDHVHLNEQNTHYFFDPKLPPAIQ
jgi:hypothetical protein